MTNFLTRLVERSAGRMPVAQPRILPRYAPVAEPGATDSEEQAGIEEHAHPGRTAATEVPAPSAYPQRAVQASLEHVQHASVTPAETAAPVDEVSARAPAPPDRPSGAHAGAPAPEERMAAQPLRAETPPRAQAAEIVKKDPNNAQKEPDVSVGTESVPAPPESTPVQRKFPLAAALRSAAVRAEATGSPADADLRKAAPTAALPLSSVLHAAPSKPDVQREPATRAVPTRLEPSRQAEPASPAVSASLESHRAPREPAAPPPVRISIGKIEVRAAAPAPQVAQSPRSAPPPRLAMADYMQQSRGKRT